MGVDPKELSELVRSAMNEKCVYHSTTSDSFFESVKESKEKFNVVFVDGLHEYSQAYRDIVNALGHLAPNGFIVVHDCNPTSEIVGLPPEEYNLLSKSEKKGNYAWTGDVWKAITLLRSQHTDLNIFTLDCDWGCGVISRGRPKSMLDFSQAQVEDLTYTDFDKNKKKYLNLKPEEFFFDFLSQ